MTPDLETLAAGLSEAHITALCNAPGAWGLPAGHNAWPLCEYDDADGDAVNDMLRAGLLSAVIPDDITGATLLRGDGDEIPDVHAKWIIELTETGLQLRTYLESRTRGEGEL